MSAALNLRETYVMRSSVVRCHGIKMERMGLDAYLANRVREWHYDIRRIAELATEISGRTGFDTDKLKEELLSTRPPSESWQAGESLAHCILEDYWFARFPYRASRDAKNPKAFLAGADIVGFYHRNDTTTLLLGEVKTSAEDRQPPQVVTSQAGLLAQMKALKDRRIQLSLMLWLVQKYAGGEHPYARHCNDAVDAYVCRGAVRLVGILIRDTPPGEADLQYAFEKLRDDTKTRLDLCALYIPVPIHTLPYKIEGT